MSKENEFESSVNPPLHFPPPRTPLNSIPDPSQSHGSDFDSRTASEKKLEPQSIDKAGSASVTPRVLTRHGKPHLEPSFGSRSGGSRLSLGGAVGASATGPKTTRGKEGSSLSSRLSRGVSTVNSDFSMEVPTFELDEDPSFWADHNVQVLIRIRPLSTMERVSQGYGRCLKQESAHTLEWLGHPEMRFTFDHIACEMISQEKLFRVAGLPMVENCMSGYNSCMFAYGQTGSGKTYTMMGEIKQMEGRLSEDSGITPRVFEYLFSRIRMEEERRRDEKLKFSCKCSFLEIYNEQITDLLEPSSTNLQLREDLKKGVYVENLTAYNVRTVNDIINLLLQGAANRKIAATHMNSESSRSHSVFTCIIESCWEKDSMTHFRFARLNLVDLAGSERQKSSGAEGDRLKEAANINKSLSTLGLVIMSLVDLAHGKQRHVPYRDSRLTFLLQDSLGGNSKTTIIANVSPSICSAHETLSTLKFAQRAKLIQNNAKVNEDASGNVGALQRQIQQLKDQLSFLMKHHNLSMSGSSCMPDSQLADTSKKHNAMVGKIMADDHNLAFIQNKKVKSMESALVGAFRREKVAETAVQKLEAEVEQWNILACQREEEVQHAKMMLRFREEKIKQLELLMDGSLPADHYLKEENKALKDEIQLLKAKIDRNPELTRFALENMRLVEQLQLFQNFYEQGERESLLVEISDLREKLQEALEQEPKVSSRGGSQDTNTLQQLEDCRDMNTKLMREVEELQRELRNYLDHGEDGYDSVPGCVSKVPEEIRHTDKYSLVESASTGSDSGDEREFCLHDEDTTLLSRKYQKEQEHLFMNISDKIDDDREKKSIIGHGGSWLQLESPEKKNKHLIMEGTEDSKLKDLQVKLDKLTEELEEARLLNCQYQEDHASELSRQHQVKIVCEQVEIETTRTILHLQDEVAGLQSELSESLYRKKKENLRLRNIIAVKEEEMRTICGEWERATLELTSFLVEGSKSLKDVSCQIEHIVCSFPQLNVQIGEHVERAARACIDKEETVLSLGRSLEDAQKTVMEMELKLNSLKEATMVMNKLPHSGNGKSTKTLENTDMVEILERKLKLKEDQIIEAEKCADVAFLVVKYLSDHEKVIASNDMKRVLPNSQLIPSMKSQSIEDIGTQFELDHLLMEFINAIDTSHRDVGALTAGLQMDILEASDIHKKLIQELVKEIQDFRIEFMDLKENYTGFRTSEIKLKMLEQVDFLKFESQLRYLHPIKDELAKMNETLIFIEDSINQKVTTPSCLSTDKYLAETDDWSLGDSTPSYSTSGSDSSMEIISLGNKADEFADVCSSNFSGQITEQKVDMKFEEESVIETSPKQSKKLLGKWDCKKDVSSCLRKELDMTFDAFNTIYVHLVKFLDDDAIAQSCHVEEMKELASGMMRENTEACSNNIKEVVSAEKVGHTSTFLNKCEEVHKFMKEADSMLNALLKANENAKELNGMWKKASEELMVQKSQLIEENEHLKLSMSLKERENKLLRDEVCHWVVEVKDYLSSLEGCFLETQKELEERYDVMFLDMSALGRELFYCICNTRSSLEDMSSDIIEKGLSVSVLYLYLVGEIHKIPSYNTQCSLYPSREKNFNMITNCPKNICWGDQDGISIVSGKGRKEGNQSQSIRNLEEGNLGASHDNLIDENLSLKKELERKEILLKGLLFDFSLLQEAASSRKDIKDESEKLIMTLNEVRHDLEIKTSQLDDFLLQYKRLENHLADTQSALAASNSDLELARETIDSLSDQAAELRMLLKDMYLKKSEAEEKLEEQKDVIKGLEAEIIHLTSSVEATSVTEEDFRKVIKERDQLHEEICSLNGKLDIAYAFADENEAIAVEARQESEASKIHAEQKEEEVKILERSVEELECTINVLEKKVQEMDEEVERHRLIRDSLEVELQALRQRLSTVENFTDVVNSENMGYMHDDRLLHGKSVELHEAHNQIKVLEKDIARRDQEIKQCKDYISELVLHSEAQASQYQEKYKTLEAMVLEVKTNLSNSVSVVPTSDKLEKSSTRTRGSSSPFRCIASLVQQMNLEKDQELSVARHRIEELEGVLGNQQKEVCVLNARLAAAESMTHDVIRDLLGVKLDMTSYANLIDQYHVQKLVEEAYHQKEEFQAKEQEILNLREQVNDLIEERESCMSELRKKGADILAAQMTLEQLQERDQLLYAQNEMLKVDKSNLLRRVAELDEMVKTLLGRQNSHQRVQKENGIMPKLSDADLAKKLARSENLLNRANDELCRYHKASGSHPNARAYGHGLDAVQRKQKS